MTMLSFAALINWLYLAGGVAVGMSYWPQLRLYWREPKTRQGIATTSWGAWAGGAFVTTCYAAVVVHDLPFTLISALNTVAYLAVFLLGLSSKRETSAPEPVDMGDAAPIPH
jgi:hypothetical protein